MKKENINENNEATALTEKDFNEFLSATGEEQFKILLAHAERNKKIIQIRRLKTMEQYNDIRNFCIPRASRQK